MSEGGGVVYIGVITPGNVAKWAHENVLQDGGAAGTGNVSAVPTPVAGHIAIWASPTTIADGGALPTGIVSAVPTPVAGHLAVWATPTTIQDGGVPATGNVVVVPAVSIGNLAVWAGPNAIQDGGPPPSPASPQAANTFYAGPVTGAAAIPTFRATVNADINGLSPSFGSVTVTGAAVPTNGMFLSGAGQIGWAVGSATRMTLDASLFHVAPNALFDGAIQLNGVTSAFPALFRSGAELHVKLADNSAFASTRGQNFIAQAVGGNYYGAFGVISGTADGIMEISNLAATDFNRLQFGGTTSAFPSLKRVATALAARLADDSAAAPMTASTFNGSTLAISTRQVLLVTGSGVYTTPANCRQLRIRMVGGGGAGGNNSAVGQNGTAANASTFNGVAANPGSGGGANGAPGFGGTGGAGTASFRIPGNRGQNGTTVTATTGVTGPCGVASAFGGACGPGDQAVANTGAGGGGGSGSSFVGNTGGPGGSGEYVELIINAPLSATYAFAVGLPGLVQGGVSSAFGIGGNGGSGIIIVDEFY